jgi:hypothetical protein
VIDAVIRRATRSVAGWDRWTRLTAVVLAVLALYVLLVFRDYGLSWDEEHSAQNGTYALAWFTSFGADDRVITEINQRLYGSAFNLVSELAGSVSPLGRYETSHLLIAMLGWTALLYTARLAAHVGGSRAGLFAMLTLALTPPFVGHAFMNPKDVPLATLFVVAAFYLLRAYSELPTPAGATLRRLAVASGLAAGTRVIGTFLLVYWAVAIGVWWLATVAAGRPRPRWRTITGWWWKPALGAWLVMVVCWPYAQLDPIRNPVRAFIDVSRFQWPGGTLFDGWLISGHDLPWFYLPTWFAISLPELYLAAFAAAIVPGIAFLVYEGRGRRWRAIVHAGFLLVAAVGPPALATWRHAVFYDGMRHFLFTLPFLAVLAGCALSAGWGELAALRVRRNTWTVIRAALAVVPVTAALASAALTVGDLYALHPYEYVYFNRLVAGGQATASARFETDYWGLSYKEGLEWLREHYPRDAGRVTVANCSIGFLTAYWIRKDPELAARFVVSLPYANPPPRILLATTRFKCHQRGGRVLHIVTRKDVPLLYVLERE